MTAKKVKLIERIVDEPWFDLGRQKAFSNTSYIIGYWIKAIIRSWHSVVEVLAQAGKIQREKINQIGSLDNYFSVMTGANTFYSVINDTITIKNIQTLK